MKTAHCILFSWTANTNSVSIETLLAVRERPGTHFTGGWLGPRTGLDGRKISSTPGFNAGPSSK